MTRELHDIPEGHFSGQRNLGAQPEGLEAILNRWRLAMTGCHSAARTAAWGGNPADGNTITIGAHVIELDNASPPVAGGGAGRTAVKIQATQEETLLMVVKAINGRVDAANITPGTDAFPDVVADALTDDTVLRVRAAAERGDEAVTGVAPNVALAKNGANIGAWNLTNLSKSGGLPRLSKSALVSLTIDAEHIALGEFTVELPFTPAVVVPFGVYAGGVRIGDTDDAVSAVDGGAKIVFGAGAAPNLQAGDNVKILALG